MCHAKFKQFKINQKKYLEKTIGKYYNTLPGNNLLDLGLLSSTSQSRQRDENETYVYYVLFCQTARRIAITHLQLSFVLYNYPLSRQPQDIDKIYAQVVWGERHDFYIIFMLTDNNFFALKSFLNATKFGFGISYFVTNK